MLYEVITIADNARQFRIIAKAVLQAQQMGVVADSVANTFQSPHSMESLGKDYHQVERSLSVGRQDRWP